MAWKIVGALVNLADEAGISIRSLYRGIGSLKEEGKILVKRGRIEISSLQAEQLEKMFGD